MLVFLFSGCHLKCHREHADKGESAMQPCVGGRYTHTYIVLVQVSLDPHLTFLVTHSDIRV